MNISKEKQEDILSKNKNLDTIKPILKKEFLGIDDVIDTIIDSIRPFYIFPESLKRPLIINLWGLTATGKTCLVDRIFDLLELKNNYMRFDVGEYTGSDYKLRADLSDSAERLAGSYPIFVFDEFQFGRTIDNKGHELASNAMRPVWDLIDSGKIINFFRANSFRSVLRVIEKCMKSDDIEIENGFVVKGQDHYEHIMRRSARRVIDYRDIDFKKLGYKEPVKKLENLSSIYDEDKFEYLKVPHIIPYDWFREYFFSANPEFFKNDYDYLKMREKHFSFNSLEDLYFFIRKMFVESSSMMNVCDFSKSLIFCIGNIDEAYNMHGSANPDADADSFHENSLKITLPIMKTALLSRFRMEQIGRLGNNHIIYPAFNKKSYAKIIEKHVNLRIEYFKKEFGIDIKFDKTINELIYKEGVFPTQGVRPLLSTFNTVLDSFISKIIADLVLNCPTVDTINWKFSFKKEKHVIQAIENGKTFKFEYDVKLCVEKLRKSDFSDSQAFTAVHEAGHAVVAAVMGGFIPDEVVSRTASISEGFCRVTWPDTITKDLCYKQIMVCLGGLEAEKLVFGPDMISTGGNSDLVKATSIASKMIKAFGMGDNKYISAISISEFNEYTAIHDEGMCEKYVIEMIKKAEEDVKECLKKNEAFLITISEFLSNNSKIETEKFKELAAPYLAANAIVVDKDTMYGFRNIVIEKNNKNIQALAAASQN